MKIILEAFQRKLRSDVMDWPENTPPEIEMVLDMERSLQQWTPVLDVSLRTEPRWARFAFYGEHVVIGGVPTRVYTLVDIQTASKKSSEEQKKMNGDEDFIQALKGMMDSLIDRVRVLEHKVTKLQLGKEGQEEPPTLYTYGHLDNTGNLRDPGGNLIVPGIKW